MAYVPTRSDATAVATDTVARLNTPGSPNAGATLKDALVALQDSNLCSTGFQVESNNPETAHSTSSSTFVDMPGASFTFTAPIAKTYVVHADTAVFFSVAGGVGYLRLVVNGSNGPTLTFGGSGTATTVQWPVHLMHAAACVAGANTIKIQWGVFGTTTINTDTNSYANFIVSG